MTSVDLTSDARELRRCSQVMLIAVVAGTGALVVADHPVTTGAWVLPTRRIRLWSDIAGSAAQAIAELGYEHSTLHRLGIVRGPIRRPTALFAATVTFHAHIAGVREFTLTADTLAGLDLRPPAVARLLAAAPTPAEAVERLLQVRAAAPPANPPPDRPHTSRPQPSPRNGTP